MEAPNILQLPPRPAPPLSSPDADGRSPAVRIQGDRLVVESLVIADPGLAAIVGERSAGDRVPFVERALRIGLLALQDAGTTLDVDMVRAEFEKLVRQSEQANERAAHALDLVLRTNFADGEGRLPRTLDRFLGDRGALRMFVAELFDEKKRDSAIGRIGTMLERYFDGDASKLAQLLDPTRASSPLHQFRGEITDRFDRLGERIVALEASSQARAAERAKGTAKGADFEDLLESLLAEIARGAGDLLDRTGGETGDQLRSKKGDFVIAVNEGVARGADLRIVVEAKDRPMSLRAIRDELREAKQNRGAAVALVVFTPAHAPSGIAPFDIRVGDVYCVLDPEAPDIATLEAATKLARLLAVASLAERDVEIDAAAVGRALAGIHEQLEAIKSLRSQLTSIRNATGAVWEGLDKLRNGILARVAEAEAELTVRCEATR
jgi:hypothetical protein